MNYTIRWLAKEYHLEALDAWCRDAGVEDRCVPGSTHALLFPAALDLDSFPAAMELTPVLRVAVRGLEPTAVRLAAKNAQVGSGRSLELARLTALR